MTEQILRGGFVGSGEQADWLWRHAWYQTPGVRAVACSDLVDEAAHSFARRRELTPYGSLERMIRDEHLDVLVICTPPGAHEQNVRAILDAAAAAERGPIAIHCEQPSALTLAEHDGMVEAAERASVVLTFGYDRLFSALNWVRELVELGVLGDVHHTDVRWVRRNGVPRRGAFTDKQLSGGGPGFDLLTHLLAMALDVNGADVERISAYLHARVIDAGGTRGDLDPGAISVEDTIGGVAWLRGGATVSFKAAWDLPQPEEWGLMLSGTRGTAGLQLKPLPHNERLVPWATIEPTPGLVALAGRDGFPSAAQCEAAAERGEIVTIRPLEVPPSLRDCRRAQLLDLAASLRARRRGEERPVRVTPARARSVLEAVIGAYASAEASRTVDLRRR